MNPQTHWRGEAKRIQQRDDIVISIKGELFLPQFYHAVVSLYRSSNVRIKKIQLFHATEHVSCS